MKGNRRSLAWAAGDFVILDAGALGLSGSPDGR